MWSTDTAWFDVAVMMSIFAVGNILFGHFEEHRPKWRRLAKVFLVVSVVVGLSVLGYRPVAYGLVGAMFAAVVYVHGWWLPRHGVNGWTGEPRDRYYEVIGVKRSADAEVE
jgi:hypothetical protein